MAEKTVLSAINSISDCLFSYLSSVKGAGHAFLSKQCRTKQLSKQSFNYFREFYSRGKIAFIDGGNANLMRSPGFSVDIIRVSAVILTGKTTLSTETYSFFLFSNIAIKKNAIYLISKLFPVDTNFKKIVEKESFEFSYSELTGLNPDNFGIEKDSMRLFSPLVGIIRKISELSLAASTIKKLSDGDMVMLDGTLEPKSGADYASFANLFRLAGQNNILITAISKTTSMLTEHGTALTAALSGIADRGKKWYCHVAERENGLNADIFIAKLHEQSDYSFRVEIQKTGILDLRKIFGIIASSSKDISFLGYPYGLIKADTYARIPNSEKEYLKTMLMAKFNSSQDTIMRQLNALNAHSVLDKISF